VKYFLSPLEKIILSDGDVTILEFSGAKHLFIKEELWAHNKERTWYEKYLPDFAKGHVLEGGLGLGDSSNIMLNLPSVISLTTVETNHHVINAYRSLNEAPSQHTVVNLPWFDFCSRAVRKAQHFDSIFIDIWRGVDEDNETFVLQCIEKALPLRLQHTKIMLWNDGPLPRRVRSYLEQANAGR
jgi:hypothetical protein